MADFVSFLGDVLSHWIALMSGIIGLALGFWEKRRQKALGSRGSLAAVLFALFIGCFLARQDEHRNSEVLKIEKAHLAGQLSGCSARSATKDETIRYQGSLIAEKSKYEDENRNTIDQDGQRLGQQQAQIGQCLINEAKLNPLIATKYQVLAIPVHDERDETAWMGRFDPFPLQPRTPDQPYAIMILIQTNRRAEPRGEINCPQPFTIVSEPLVDPLDDQATFIQEVNSPVRLSDRAYRILVNDETPWQDANPIHFWVLSKIRFHDGCRFTPS